MSILLAAESQQVTSWPQRLALTAGVVAVIALAAAAVVGFVLFLITFTAIAGARLLLGAERYR